MIASKLTINTPVKSFRALKEHGFGIVLAGLLVLAGCSSTPTRVDHGPIRAHTFNFIHTVRPDPGTIDTRAGVNTMIQDAITRNLAGRGLTRVAENGDITVAYLVILGNNVSTVSINDYFGYGEEAAALQEKAQDAYSGSKNPNHFEAGTLLIDLVDTRTFKLLKRNYATRPVLRNISDDARAARIQQVVDEILQTVRIEP
jgi:hypothetical protein